MSAIIYTDPSQNTNVGVNEDATQVVVGVDVNQNQEKDRGIFAVGVQSAAGSAYMRGQATESDAKAFWNLSATHGVRLGNGSNDQPPEMSGDGLHVDGDTIRVSADRTPTGTNDPSGYDGEMCSDKDYFYKKTDEGWKRAALSTW